MNKKPKTPKIPKQIDMYKLHKLLLAYNLVRSVKYKKTDKFIIGYLPQELSEYTTYQKIIDFLEENKIDDWYLYFYALFMSTRWQIVWYLKSCYGPKALETYKNWRNQAMESIGMTARVEEGTETKKSEWVDVFEHIELLKARLLKKGNELVCKGNKEKFLGYHPKSEVCNGCPLKGNCASELYNMFQLQSNSDVDILAVRQGYLSRETANQKLKASGCNFEI